MTKQQCKICVFAALFFVFSCLAPGVPRVFGQAKPDSGWNLINGEGEILLTKDGKRTPYQNGTSKSTGILLGAGDMVQTGRGTAELRFLSNGSSPRVILKLGENTSVIIEKPSDEISLELIYGRLVIQNTGDLSVKAGYSSVFFRACDTELYYVAKPGTPQPVLIINCSRGEGELTANIASGPEGARFAVKGGESLSLEYHIPFAYVERKSLEMEPDHKTPAGSAY